MSNIVNLFKNGAVASGAMVSTAIVAMIAILGITTLNLGKSGTVDMRIEPAEKTVLINDTFEINVVVESAVPANVFSGELLFNPEVLKVKSIDYNTSIADLWVELPWYSNGDGTLNFAGGTTRPGGFTGSDSLIKVTFETLHEGEGVISLNDPRILLHDGLGTDAQLKEGIDAIFTVGNEVVEKENLAYPTNVESSYKVAKELPSTDLNNDGKQSMVDISIFMLHMTGDDARYDFNLDGKVNLKDLNILLAQE